MHAIVQADDCFYFGGEMHSIGGQNPASAGRPDGVVRSIPEGHLVQWCPTVRGGADSDLWPEVPTLETVLAYGAAVQEGKERRLPGIVYAMAAVG